MYFNKAVYFLLSCINILVSHAECDITNTQVLLYLLPTIHWRVKSRTLSEIFTYLHCYVCVQWSRPFQSWSRLVLGSQTVPPKNLHFLIVAECSLTGSGQRQPLGCAQLQHLRHTGTPHVHVVLAHCCQSGVHHWEWGYCRPGPLVHPYQLTARYGGHTVWGSGPFQGCRQGCLHRVFDREVLRWGCWSLTGRGKGHGAHGYRSHSSGVSPTQVRVDGWWQLKRKPGDRD